MGFSKSWLASFLSSSAKPPETLGILSFEAGRAMSRLVSLHQSLSDPELLKLRSKTTRTFAVTHLVSTNQVRLLRLACAELSLDLDLAAASVSRLSPRCRSPIPRAFPHLFSDLKSSSSDFDRRLALDSKLLRKAIRKMERYAAGVALLHSEMETLAEMEASDRKLQRWRSYSGPLTAPGPPANPQGADLFQKKLVAQRRTVRRLQEESIWSKSIDKVAELMARAAFTIFGRMCSVFAIAVPELPAVHPDRHGRYRVLHQIHPNYAMSGPLERPRVALNGNSGPIMTYGGKKETAKVEAWAAREMVTREGTVGGAGLELRYAEVITTAEKMMYAPDMVSDEAREELYGMLSNEVREGVAARRGEVEGAGEQAAGMGRETARKVLAWLAPMADDTVRWHAERSCERRTVEAVGPRVMALQTLRFADRGNTEHAIVEVLVGLSCVMRYLNGMERSQGGTALAGVDVLWEAR